MVVKMIIGLTGKAGSGKSTLAAMLVKHHGFVEIGLADPLKRACQEWFDFSDEQLFGSSEKRNAPDTRYVRVPAYEKPLTMHGLAHGEIVARGVVYVSDEYLTPRHALQTLGTEWGRACYENVWIDYALRAARFVERREASYTARQGLDAFVMYNPEESAPNVVIPDVRFWNELKAIRAAGGKLVRILRHGAGLATTHASETEQDSFSANDFDFQIFNDDTLEDLEVKAYTMIECLTEKGNDPQ